MHLDLFVIFSMSSLVKDDRKCSLKTKGYKNAGSYFILWNYQGLDIIVFNFFNLTIF